MCGGTIIYPPLNPLKTASRSVVSSGSRQCEGTQLDNNQPIQPLTAFLCSPLTLYLFPFSAICQLPPPSFLSLPSTSLFVTALTSLDSPPPFYQVCTIPYELYIMHDFLGQQVWQLHF